MKRIKNILSVVAILMVASRACGASLSEGLTIASSHTLVSDSPPGKVPTNFMVDGPIMGNGDVGVVLAGQPDRLKFYIGKNDFWSVKLGSPINVGRIEIRCPELRGGTWRTELDMAQAEVRGAFAKGASKLGTRSFVDANHNLLVTELTNAGSVPLNLTVVAHKAQEQGGSQTGDGDFFYAPYDEPDGKTPLPEGHQGPILAPLPPEGAPRVAVATRILGVKTTAENVIALVPGAKAIIATIILSNFNAEDCVAQAKKDADLLTVKSIGATADHHRQWWAEYWTRSFIEITDKTIERACVAGNYGMASCSRAGKIAPGLWGNWITMDKPAWRGDFHLNYNFQAPFYGVYANNHPELAEPFYRALTESVPEGREMAKRHTFKGLYFPVSIGPWGWRPWGTDMTLDQKSNAAYAAMLFIFGWQYTQDTEWLKSAGYPFLRETAEFWDNYLKLENGPDGKPRYVIHADAIHEGSGDNVNPILSLGMLRSLYATMLETSQVLGVDSDRRVKWQDILDKISAFPTQKAKDGKTIFRYTEAGLAWCDSNTLGIQHIFPGAAINLDSDPKLLEICHNMIPAMSRWEDGNGSSSWYPALARVGYNPTETLERLHQCIVRHSAPNGIMFFGGGGIENWAGPMMITEFLMQSEPGHIECRTIKAEAGHAKSSFVLRLFPCWPKEGGDARFGNLRAKGAFLVSAELKNGIVSGVKIVSEKGRDCVAVNPWPGKKVTLVRNGRRTWLFAETRQGERFSFKTAVNETVELSPEK
ncbi:MAG: hypothetical protein WCK89_17405 [bacterium]